jgi:ketosteroid isomerase-like protein
MKTKQVILILSLLLLPFLLVMTAVAAESAGEQALREADTQWSKAAGSKDVDKTVSFYADGAYVLPPNAPIATTRQAIRNAWKDLLSSLGLVISWKPTKVEVAKSGEIGFVTGTYDVTMNDASGKPTNDHGKYLEVWKKNTDGSWKCWVDTWNSDLPLLTDAVPEKK